MVLYLQTLIGSPISLIFPGMIYYQAMENAGKLNKFNKIISYFFVALGCFVCIISIAGVAFIFAKEGII